jgi:hypothetical protein
MEFLHTNVVRLATSLFGPNLYMNLHLKAYNVVIRLTSYDLQGIQFSTKHPNCFKLSMPTGYTSIAETASLGCVNWTKQTNASISFIFPFTRLNHLRSVNRPNLIFDTLTLIHSACLDRISDEEAKYFSCSPFCHSP